MKNDNLIEIHLEREGLRPGDIRSKDIADLISAFEDAIASIASGQSIAIKKEDIFLGLAILDDHGCIRLGFWSKLFEVACAATSALCLALSLGDFSDLPDSSKNPIRKIADFSRKTTCDIEMYLPGEDTPSASISPDNNIGTSATVTGNSSIYGKVITVGGKSPTVRIETSKNGIITCSLRGNRNFAKRIAGKLYSYIGVEGKATWNSDDLSLKSFEIHSLLDYHTKDTSESWQRLCSVAGPHYDEIEDVEAYINDLRRGEEET